MNHNQRYGPPSGPNFVPNFWQDFLPPLEAAKMHNIELLNSILSLDSKEEKIDDNI